MALQKQPVSINFAKGVSTKADPYQVPIGNFLALHNSVFDKTGALSKRPGFPLLTTLPNAEQTTLTKLNDNLLATGSNLYAYSQNTDQWLNQGTVQPVQLEVQSLVRVSTSQTSPDAATTAAGLTCLVYIDSGAAYYQISDSNTGQQIVPRQALPSTSTTPRVFILGRYFIITFLVTVAGSPHLRYIAIPTSIPTSPGSPTDISSDVSSLSAGYDGAVVNNALYLSWAASASNVKITSLSTTLIVSAAVTMTSQSATLMSVVGDVTASTPVIWVSFWDDVSEDGYAAAFNQALAPILAPVQIINGETINEITSIAVNQVLTVVYENDNTYTYAPNAKTDYLSKLTVTQAGVVSSPTIILRSVGLASKAFMAASGTMYVLATYGEVNQPTYFLIDFSGNIYMRLAYSNGGGYGATQVLPSVSVIDDVYSVPYLIKDFLASVNKGTQLPSGTPVNGIYTQTGINLAKFGINVTGQYSSEIANTLHLTGGQLWQYDGVKPVEHGFHVWPENMVGDASTSTGALTEQLYYYVFTYEWTDNQGNLHRSAPSIPLPVTVGAGENTVTLDVPTLRLTYKTSPNPVRIVGYRWSVAQQTYYQFTSITSPVVNNPAVDSVQIIDLLADSAILGQTLLYTTGGVIENIAAPASVAAALFKNRLFLIDAEDPNLLWYSKEVIETTPVEMSDLLTRYIAPTSGAQGSTGKTRALSAMDDKLIIFKSDAIYYMTGNGPDNTGANNDFSEPIFITSSVGCSNPSSIVLTPNGLMFQSSKGIWLLGRDLSTSYIGDMVEAYNSLPVLSAMAIPSTNQVRFVLPGNTTLMYDYYMQQWGTHGNISAISATLIDGSMTYLSSAGRVYRERPGTYIDGSQPVLMSFTTSWVNIAGLQGYERFYFLYLLGTYFTPFLLNVEMAYDYNSSAIQAVQVTPDNYSPAYGGDPVYGSGTPYGGESKVFEARVFPQLQKCESFQISVREVYDSSFGVPAGQGLTLSGLNLVIGVKKGYRTQKAGKSFG
jgi:hypothetical protein